MVAFRIEDAYVGALADRMGLKARDIPKTYSKQYDRFVLMVLSGSLGSFTFSLIFKPCVHIL